MATVTTIECNIAAGGQWRAGKHGPAETLKRHDHRVDIVKPVPFGRDKCVRRIGNRADKHTQLEKQGHGMSQITEESVDCR